MLLELAKGIQLDRGEEFVVKSLPEEFRKLQKQLSNTFKKSYQKLWSKKKDLILAKEDIKELMCDLHFSSSHLTVKPGVVDGRILLDVTNSEKDRCLNSAKAKEKGVERYRRLELPNIRDIFRTWIYFCRERKVLLTDCAMWNDDISGAFPQLWFRSDDVKFLATMVDEHLFLYTCAGFLATATCRWRGEWSREL